MWSEHPIFGTYRNFSFATAPIPPTATHISPFLCRDAVQVLQAIKDLQNPLFFLNVLHSHMSKRIQKIMGHPYLFFVYHYRHRLIIHIHHRNILIIIIIFIVNNMNDRKDSGRFRVTCLFVISSVYAVYNALRIYII